MKNFYSFYLLPILLLLSSCASQQPDHLKPFIGRLPLSVQEASLKEQCAAVYPRGRWQFVHTIEFRMADGRSSSVVGVTVVDGNTLSCALMTIEGFTLFQARLNDRLEIDRAVPPFDRPGFARGLMEDVRALFVRPPASEVSYGSLADTAQLCRMTTADGRITDILPLEDGCWRIRTYDRKQALTRTITARSCRLVDSTMIPDELKLTVPGPAGYILKMTLVTAVHGNNPSPALSAFLFPNLNLGTGGMAELRILSP